MPNLEDTKTKIIKLSDQNLKLEKLAEFFKPNFLQSIESIKQMLNFECKENPKNSKAIQTIWAILQSIFESKKNQFVRFFNETKYFKELSDKTLKQTIKNFYREEKKLIYEENNNQTTSKDMRQQLFSENKTDSIDKLIKNIKNLNKNFIQFTSSLRTKSDYLFSELTEQASTRNQKRSQSISSFFISSMKPSLSPNESEFSEIKRQFKSPKTDKTEPKKYRNCNHFKSQQHKMKEDSVTISSEDEEERDSLVDQIDLEFSKDSFSSGEIKQNVEEKILFNTPKRSAIKHKSKQMDILLKKKPQNSNKKICLKKNEDYYSKSNYLNGRIYKNEIHLNQKSRKLKKKDAKEFVKDKRLKENLPLAKPETAESKSETLSNGDEDSCSDSIVISKNVKPHDPFFLKLVSYKN